MTNKPTDERVTKYPNAPLPAHLEAAAYFAGNREWALPKAEALEYLDWCEQRGLRVLGFDVWYPTTPGPTVTDTGYGNIEGIAAVRKRILDHPGQYPPGPVVFNVVVVVAD